MRTPDEKLYYVLDKICTDYKDDIAADFDLTDFANSSDVSAEGLSKSDVVFYLILVSVIVLPIELQSFIKNIRANGYKSKHFIAAYISSVLVMILTILSFTINLSHRLLSWVVLVLMLILSVWLFVFIMPRMKKMEYNPELELSSRMFLFQLVTLIMLSGLLR